MNIVFNFVLALQILSALAMIGLVLIQHGKGADMGASFGSGASGSLFGATGSANFLSRSTAVLRGRVLRLHAGAGLLVERPAQGLVRQHARSAVGGRVGTAELGLGRRRDSRRSEDASRCRPWPPRRHRLHLSRAARGFRRRRHTAEVTQASARIRGCPASHSSCQPKQQNPSAPTW